jgi:hypothetical protein
LHNNLLTSWPSEIIRGYFIWAAAVCYSIQGVALDGYVPSPVNSNSLTSRDVPSNLLLLKLCDIFNERGVSFGINTNELEEYYAAISKKE